MTKKPSRAGIKGTKDSEEVEVTIGDIAQIIEGRG